MKTRVEMGQKVLSRNDELASGLRRRWEDRGVFCVNLVSSPGSGKTTLLERTLERLRERVRAAVLVGDVQTENDANRLRATGVPVCQIVTGGTCHLEAEMVGRHLEKVDDPDLQLLFIENVGNLVCPASYDLGEDARVVLLSTVEGDDKPQKYPGIFRRSQAFVLTKSDLLGLTDFDPDRAEAHARALNPAIETFRTSARTGEGLDAWCTWLEEGVHAKRARAAERA
ncbi:hydrogenase nickel incorporation protein HypB [Limnochorda pilosa]|uniref:Hydantoin utilization protein A n=1 Tax=Limnochorda pilosa TaxID=1555112 RepID=A0A0K2SHI9_LIMPI|nr:hydrogenase nickel incorporation protein HypB [Limnochorda pilosa]BAS26502.1 hydantoin utilization protein A [Limnochorda pilosa]